MNLYCEACGRDDVCVCEISGEPSPFRPGVAVEFIDKTRGRADRIRTGVIRRVISEAHDMPAMAQIEVDGWRTRRWKRLADVRLLKCPRCDGDGFGPLGSSCEACGGSGKASA